MTTPVLRGPFPIGIAVLGEPLRAQDGASATAHRVGRRRTLTTIGDVPISDGAFGSGLSRNPRTGHWLALTDRGPNFDVAEDVKSFPVPAFQPTVGRFRLVGRGASRRLVLVERIRLRHSDGAPMIGLPSSAGPGATGEKAIDGDGRDLPATPNGIDPEGIHALQDGTFWIAEEYGPSLIHFDRSGREIERVTPFSTGKALPRSLVTRRPNRGFEGLTGDPDGTRLIAIVQSPLDNPKAAGRASRNTRIVIYHPASGTAEQFLYRLEQPQFFVGDLTLLPDGTLLVLENDGSPPSPASHRRIYRVDLTNATPIGEEPATGPTIETLDSVGLAGRGIEPVSKTLVVDLGALGYPHDKPEGIVAIGPTEIAIINDDDFGIASGPAGRPVAKRLLGADGPTDQSELWIVRLPQPLWAKSGASRPNQKP